MSEDRTIKSLQPRVRKTGAAANLDASQRNLTALEMPEPEAVTEPPVVERIEENPAVKKPAKKPVSNTKPAKAQIAVFVPAELRGRARAALKHASYHENVPSFSDLVANALEAEVRRLEIAYNNGALFEPVADPLPKGRPAGRTK